ncbi:hypothetical protein TNCV_5070241 [Trichonephila clavipes]|nr:hypothetical protein TNCV_5070241 [Trichonephila clavipes]
MKMGSFHHRFPTESGEFAGPNTDSADFAVFLVRFAEGTSLGLPQKINLFAGGASQPLPLKKLVSLRGASTPHPPKRQVFSLFFLSPKKNPFKHQGSRPSSRLIGRSQKSLSSYLRITHQNTTVPSGPRRHNSLSNIWTHLSITPPVSSIPFSQHQKRRHDYFKTGFTYCQWDTGSPLPLWRPVRLSSLPEFRQ